MLQSTDPKKLNKKEGPSEDASIPLRRGNKIIMGGRGREGPGWERGQGGKGGPESGIGGDRREAQRVETSVQEPQCGALCP